MKKTLFVLLSFIATIAFGGIENARVVRHTGLAATLRSYPEEWVAYEVATPSNRYVMCCMDWIGHGKVNISTSRTCHLGGGGSSFMGTSSDDGISRIDHSRMIVAIRAGRVEVYSVGCPVDAAGMTVHAVDNVSVDESLSALEGMVDGHRHGALAAIAMHASPRSAQILERIATGNGGHELRGEAIFWLAQTGGRRGFEVARRMANDDPDREVRKKAVFALTQSSDPEVFDALASLARNHHDSDTRGEAIFWLGQKAGTKIGTIRESADRDPSAEVREMAVFAISQRPRDEAIPELVELTHHKDPAVRKKAIFWLSQMDDPRALAAIEKILLH